MSRMAFDKLLGGSRTTSPHDFDREGDGPDDDDDDFTKLDYYYNY